MSGSNETVRPAKRVLVVDDDEGNATLLTRLLELGGHQVRVATDGPAALAQMRDFQPQVILLDIGLPGMDGYEVARRLRSESASPRAMVVAVSGYDQDEESDARRLLFDHYLIKPASLDVLQGLIDRAN